MDAGWGLSYACEHNDLGSETVSELSILGPLLLMITGKPKLARVALRIAGNIVSGNDVQVRFSFFYVSL